MLKKRQKQILDYIKKFIKEKNYSPSFEEIRKHFGFVSKSTVHHHIETLKEKGHLKRSRTIELSKDEKTSGLVEVPLLGTIAAGEPIEAIQEKETIAVPQDKLPRSGDFYALRVMGDSMIDEGINDGEVILIRQQNVADNGQRVVALINHEGATVKKFYKDGSCIRLQPANKKYEPIIIKKGTPIEIQGIVVGVIKNQPKTSSFLEDGFNKAIEKYKKLPINQIIMGDAIEEMKKIPSSTIDMTFADPPFNLNKKYGNYKDTKTVADYIEWCEKWLTEMVRITKPTGSIFVHNIPKWLTYFAHHLNKIAFFKHWIAWDAMSTPLGKTLLPAHYGILFYTKESKGFKFNELRSPHKKCRNCGEMIKDYGGKKSQINPYGTLLSDVWTDLHRIRHNARRDNHPCQLPEPLLERLILMTTDEGDVILDPFIGAGTTALAAKRLGRNYIGIDIDPKYKKIVGDKIKKVNYRSSNGYLYNGNHSKTASKYLRNLTISEKEGIYPIDNPQFTSHDNKQGKRTNPTLFQHLERPL